MTLLALSFLTSGVSLSIVCAVAGLVFAFFLIFAVIKSSPGNARMQEIAGAIQEGAKAYLNRQVITISAIAVVIFILLFIWKDHATAAGFLVGAVCSLSAGRERQSNGIGWKLRCRSWLLPSFRSPSPCTR